MYILNKRFKIMLISFFMIGILSFNSFESKVYADAGTIVIAGGSLAAGGLGAGALAGLGGPVVIAVMLAGLAFGMNVELTQASEEAGMTKTQFVQSKINEYCTEAQITAGVFNDAIVNGMTVLNDGRISLTDQASRQIKQFYNWLFANDDVQPLPSGAIENTVTINGYTFPVSDTWIASDKRAVFSNPVACARTTRGICVWFNKIGATGTITFLPNINSSFSLNSTENTYKYTSMNTDSVFTSKNGMAVTDVPYVWDDEFLRTLNGTFDVHEMDAPITNDTFTGDRDTYNNNSGVLNPSAGQTTIINPGAIGSISVPAGQDVTVDVRAYLEALQKILDKLNDITVPAVDDATGIPVDLDIDDSDVIEPTITKEDDTDLPSEDDQTPVIDENPVDPSNDITLASDPLKFDLRNIFPFCIPFDIKDMLGKLSSEPVAPTYTVNWNIPIVNTNLNFTVDLSPFNSVASVLRNMELIAFVIGLAFITRSLIRG